MSSDHRIIDASGNRMPYTCENILYKTDITRGNPSNTQHMKRGSVFNQSLIDSQSHSLWLEYVIDKQNDDTELFWLMWYDSQGKPTIPLSGIFRRNDIQLMVGRLAEFILIP